MILRDLLRVLGSSDRRDGRNLTHEEAYRAFLTILDGEESEIRVGAFLIALRWKGVTVEEVTGFARAARERATIPCQELPGLVCVCPPHDGYDYTPPLEVAAALVAAGAGAKVLLVADRGVPPKRGLTAAHVLEHLGSPLSWDPAESERHVRSAGFGAVAAPGKLPGLLGLRRGRGEVGVGTPLSTVEKQVVPASA
jgi:anthranilate phosphoribosyltransferase